MHSESTLTRAPLVAQVAIVSLMLNMLGLYVFKHIVFLLRSIFTNYALPNAGSSIMNFSHLIRTSRSRSEKTAGFYIIVSKN
jgi:hypothetical protein